MRDGLRHRGAFGRKVKIIGNVRRLDVNFSVNIKGI